MTIVRISEQVPGRKRQFGRRPNFLFGFIGHNRTGKTSISIEMAKQWKQSRPDGTVIAFDPQRKFLEQKVKTENGLIDLVDETIYAHDKYWADKVLEERNALLILDDYRLIHPKNIANEGLAKLMTFREEYNIDIIYITHSPALVLNILTYYTTHYFIFFTLSTLGMFEKKIPHYGLCQASVQYINKYVKKHGKGKYPKFPYIVVNTETEELIGYNVKL